MRSRAVAPRGTPHDVILFTPGPGWFVAGVGQRRRGVAGDEAGEGSHFWPQFLGDGEHFHLRRRYLPKHQCRFPERRAATEPDEVPGADFFPRLRARIHFLRAGCRHCSHDRSMRRVSSSRAQPKSIVDGIPVLGPGRAPFSVSAAGVLAYWPYPLGTPAVLQWFERDGRASPASARRRSTSASRCRLTPASWRFRAPARRRRGRVGPGSRRIGRKTN